MRLETMQQQRLPLRFGEGIRGEKTLPEAIHQVKRNIFASTHWSNNHNDNHKSTHTKKDKIIERTSH